MLIRAARMFGWFALLLCGACGSGSSSHPPSQTAGTQGADAAGTAGAAGDAGAAGTGGGAGAAGANSVGCGTTPPLGDSATKWTKHDIDLPAGSVDAAFVAAHPPDTGTQYSWTHRNYFVKLPSGYDPQKAYPVTIAGAACADDETVGASGAYAVPAGTQTEAIEISQSFVLSMAATPGCPGFADDFPNSPEPAYVHAVIAEVKRTYCVDEAKVFINGFDLGAFQAIMAGCTNTDEVRAYGVQMGGGLRMHRPQCKAHAMAAMFIAGTMDTLEPIGPLTKPQNDTLGTSLERDDLLQRNGCVGDATAPWNGAYPKCVTYTGCPVKYPVVWCPLEVAHISTASDPDMGVLETYRRQGLWDFYKSLPPQ